MYFDLLLLFLIFIFAIYGLIQGFVKQLISLLCLLSIIFFAQPLATWLKTGSGWTWFKSAPPLSLFGMSCIFILLLFMATGGIVHYAKKNPFLSPADRWIGAAFGTIKGMTL